MAEPRTPIQTRAARHLPILRQTTTSASQKRLPARNVAHLKHSHALKGGRFISRMNKGGWEVRLAKILELVEEHRYGRANALHFALSNVKALLTDVEKKREEMETFSEELQASNEEMRASNEEMRASNEELRTVTRELERTHEDLEQILTIAPGDLEGPMGKITALAKELRDRLGSEVDSDALDQLGVMADHSAGMEKMITALLAYWRVDVEGRPSRPVESGIVFERVLANLKSEIKKSKAEITHDALPAVEMDEQQLEQLFQILVDNAIKFRGKKPPRIHVSGERIEDSAIRIPQSEIEKGWLFSVVDNGTGIAEDEKDRIFRIFHGLREKNAASDPGMGSGMGLAIAWRIVNRHGGQIWVESQPGEGSTFYFTIV